VSKDLNLKLGRILADSRNQRNLSQEKLANMANLDRSYISRVERGIISPTIKNLHIICEILEIRASEK
jgi:transcriptional regulator with XRE-family HTH domain